MTNTNVFDAAAARAWLEGPDPDASQTPASGARPYYTVAEELGIEDDFSFESDDWLSVLEDLVGKAVNAELLPDGTLVWLTCSGEGGLDGALVTRDYDGPSLKLCSSYLELRDLIDDSTASMGIDCAVSTLSAIHGQASGLKLPDLAAPPTTPDHGGTQ